MVLIYRDEVWVVIYAMLKVLKSFHYQVNRRIADMSAQRIGWGGGSSHWCRRPCRWWGCCQLNSTLRGSRIPLWSIL